MNPVERALAAFAASRPGSWFYLNIANPIDRRLLPLTNGRISLSLGQPVLCLEVMGAKSGEIRRTPPSLSPTTAPPDLYPPEEAQ